MKKLIATAAIACTGAAVLLVEQNAGLALSVAERGYLMQSGKIVVASPIADLRDSSLMRELYLGGGKRPLGSFLQGE